MRIPSKDSSSLITFSLITSSLPLLFDAFLLIFFFILLIFCASIRHHQTPFLNVEALRILKKLTA